MSDINIIHADSQILAQAGMKHMLSKGGGIGKIKSVSDSKELKNALRKGHYDVLIIDYNQDHFFDRRDLIKIREKYPELRVLVISGDSNWASIIEVLESGVNGYLTRQCDEDEILQAIFSINKGEKFYCNKIMDILMERSNSPDDDGSCAPTSLSERETEITKLIAEGLTTKEIADKLCLSNHTVSTHRKNILKKLNVSSASALVKYAIHAGLIYPN